MHQAPGHFEGNEIVRGEGLPRQITRAQDAVSIRLQECGDGL